MTHPEIEAAGEVLNREQFNQVYAPRGWVLMDEATEFANTQLGRFVRDTSAGESKGGLTKDEARGLIAVRGGEYPDSDASGAEVLASYHETFEGRPPVAASVTESPVGVPIALYDPKDHPVNPSSDGSDQGVLAYLENADDDERQRVLELEEAGQARTTVLNWSPPATDSAEADNTNQEG
jgi:hypothetical protein